MKTGSGQKEEGSSSIHMPHRPPGAYYTERTTAIVVRRPREIALPWSTLAVTEKEPRLHWWRVAPFAPTRVVSW